MATEPRLTVEQQDQALAVVAEWLGPQMGYDGPAPTGSDAASAGEGPELIRDWDRPSSGPTPTILLEGGPSGWAIYAGQAVGKRLKALGVSSEPYASYALCLYPL